MLTGAYDYAMKRSTFRPPTPEQIERQRERRREAAERYRERRRAKFPDVGKIERSGRLPRVNRKRRKRLQEAQYGPPGFVEWVHSLGCSVPSCRSTEIEAAHARSRGAGGDWTDILPLCVTHHRMQHTMGIRTFERHVGFRLADVAASVHQRWLAFAGKPNSEEVA